jgi:hypothetical protein
MNECDILEEAKRRFVVGLDLWCKERNDRNELNDEVVVGSPLSSREAIGELDRDDFPLLRGKEVLMQAVYRGSAGQAFTSVSGSFKGTLGAGAAPYRELQACRLDLNYECCAPEPWSD